LPRGAKRQRNQKNAPPAGSARRQRRKRGWLRTILFYLLFPLVVWLVAFLVWFYWHDLTRNFSKAGDKPKDAVKRESKIEAREKVDSKKPEQVREKILDEDRQKLEDILKRRQ
jgi:flagellar biosynthesis/type III secretory pathway M-ring protein FliF/YscJ